MLVGFALSGCAVLPAPQNAMRDVSGLPDAVKDALTRSGLPPSSLSIVVRRARDGVDAISVAPDRAFAPASTMKLLPTLAAIEILGPQHRARTLLATSAPQVGARIEGDIALIGGGSVDFDFDALRGMLTKLRLRGVNEIAGDLILDRTLFSPERLDVDVPPFDEAPEFEYNVIPDALLIRSNLLLYRMKSSAISMVVTMEPALAGVEIDLSAMKFVERRCRDWEDGWYVPTTTVRDGIVRIHLRGEFPQNCVASTQLNVVDRDIVLERSFRKIWSELGGTWQGRARVGKAVLGAQSLAEHAGRPLSALLAAINKPSDNAQVRTLYLLLGAQVKNADFAMTSSQRAERALRTWLREHKIDDREIVFENGSGLSRSERIPAAQLAAFLQRGLVSPWSHEFIASLPIAGTDGTLRNRLRDTPAQGRARLKTGTLRDVVALAGYVPDASGELYIVVVMINDPKLSQTVGRTVVDALVAWVAGTDLRQR